MLKEIVTKTFIGLEEKDDEYWLKYIEGNTKNYNIDQIPLSDFISDINNKNFLNKNIQGIFYKSKYFKDTIKDINIKELEKTLKIINDDYNKIINLLEEEINKFKKRIHAQILLAKTIIDVYNSSINSDKITYQIIFNTKNILKFNQINKDEIFPAKNNINLEYNIFKPFPLDDYIEENITIQTIQKNANIKIKKEAKEDHFISISSMLYLEQENKLLLYNKNKIISFNFKDFNKEDEIELNEIIISLNLLKDKNIYIGFSNSIKILKFENNKMVILNYLDKDINLYKPGKIINYKNSLAWTNGQFICFNSNEEDFSVNNKSYINYEDSGYTNTALLELMEFKNNYLIYFYSTEYYDHHDQGSYCLYLGVYKNYLSNRKEIYLKEDNEHISYGYDNDRYLDNHYKLDNYKINEIIAFTPFSAFIISISNLEVSKKISISEHYIINSYCLNNINYLFLLSNDVKRYYYCGQRIETKKENTNLIIMKITDNEVNNKILYKSSLKMKEDIDKLYYIKRGNENYIIKISIPKNNEEIDVDDLDEPENINFETKSDIYEEISFYQLINFKNNKKVNMNKIYNK